MVKRVGLIVVRLWFQSLDRAIRCILEKNTSFYVTPVDPAVEMSLAWREMGYARFFRTATSLQRPPRS